MARRSIIAVLLALAAAALSAQLPKTVKEVPIYPGAVRDDAALAAERDEMSGAGESSPAAELSREVVYYRSTAAAEDIFAWYRQKLDAKPQDSVALPPLKPGAAIPAGYDTTPYGDQDFRDGRDPVSGKKTFDGAWVREQLKARRKPVAGEWLSQCSFSWGHVDKQGRGYQFVLSAQDETFFAYQGMGTGPGAEAAIGKKEYRQSVSIRVELVVSKSEAELQDEGDAADEAVIEARKAEFTAAPPGAKELGVPLYPGAVFNADASAGMSMDEDSVAYIFLSTDAPAKIAAFYEKATGKKAEAMGAAFRIVLKGSGLMPEHFLSIEPNTMFGGKARTVLSVFKIAP